MTLYMQHWIVGLVLNTSFPFGLWDWLERWCLSQSEERGYTLGSKIKQNSEASAQQLTTVPASNSVS